MILSRSVLLRNEFRRNRYSKFYPPLLIFKKCPAIPYFLIFSWFPWFSWYFLCFFFNINKYWFCTWRSRVGVPGFFFRTSKKSWFENMKKNPGKKNFSLRPTKKFRCFQIVGIRKIRKIEIFFPAGGKTIFSPDFFSDFQIMSFSMIWKKILGPRLDSFM